MSFEQQSTVELQSAMQWWQTYLMEVNCEQADIIRDGPLQDIHALTRHMELISSTAALETSTQRKHWLSQLQALYRDLETTSDKLAPPQFIDLTLAIHQRVVLWKARNPSLSVNIDGQVKTEAVYMNRLLLRTLDALLNVMSQYMDSVLQLELRQHEDEAHLSIAIPLKISYQDLPVHVYQELGYLKTSFIYLSRGSCRQDPSSNEQKKYLNCFFHWPTSYSSSLNSSKGDSEIING